MTPGVAFDLPVVGARTSAEDPQDDDIRIDYHPAALKVSETYRFEAYNNLRRKPPPAPPSATPWRPWRCRLDFEVAEHALDVGLNEKQTNRLLELIHKSTAAAQEQRMDEICSLKNADEMKKIWELASNKTTGVWPSFA